jgi:FtsP/CotA-like multicopper oxidase with cupredoxin domain
MTTATTGGFSAVAALLLGGAVAIAQTVPDVPPPADGIVRALGDAVQPSLDGAAATPAQVTSELLAAAPAVGPLYATYARGLFEPPVAIDTNPDPNIVEVTLVAIPALWKFHPGVPTLVWTFNGTIPGPTIDAKKDDEVIVHFTNLVDTPMSIHWHGVEVPATMDGSHTSAPAIVRGGSFTYRFHVSRPSLFWYHPHHQSAEQVERGLYGALLVHDPVGDSALGLEASEHILVLDDALLAADGQFESFIPDEPADRAAYEANGREGNVLLVNGHAGRTLPVEPGGSQRLRIVNTANSRFMRLNVPGHDLFVIGTDGGLLESPQDHAPIGQVRDPDPTHGGIMVSDNDPNHGVLLTPGERADVVITPTGASGSLLPVEWHDWGRGRHFYYVDANGNVTLFHVHSAYPSLPPRKLFDLQLAGEGTTAADWASQHPQLRTITPLVPATDAKVLKITMGHTNADPQGNITFFMQTADGTRTGTPVPFPLVDSDAANKASVGETAVWEVTNAAHGDHNFHTHGFEFQPLSVDYFTCDSTLANPVFDHSESFPLEEKDSIRIPGPPQPGCTQDANGMVTCSPNCVLQAPGLCKPCQAGAAYTVLRAAVNFDATGRENDIEASGKIPQTNPPRSGGWMVHCHILEHSDNGMMTFFELRNP